MKKEISQRVQGPIKRICSFQVPLERNTPPDPEFRQYLTNF
jgi:hypothetical protein